MDKTASKNPPFVIENASYSLFMNTESFGSNDADAVPAGARTALLDTDHDNEYGQLCATHMDLRLCEHLCDVMTKQRLELKPHQTIDPGGPPFIDDMRSSMIASHIEYCRCFGSGTRQRLDYRKIWREGDSAREAHRYFKDARDKFLAHCVNDFESTGVALVYEVDNFEPSVTHIADTIGTSTLPNDYLIQWLRRLSKQAQVHIENRIDELSRRIMKFGKQLSRGELDTMSELYIRAGDFSNPGKAKGKKSINATAENNALTK